MNLPVPTDDQRRSVLTSRLKLRKALLDTLGKVRPGEPAQQPLEQVVKAITNNRHRDWLAQSHDDERLISYARSKGVRFLPERRTKTTLARYIRRKWPDKTWISDSDLECFCNKVMSLLLTDASLFRMICGTEITAAYRDKIGGHSCMTCTACDKVAIYEANPDKVQMLVYDDGSMTARALVWKTDQGKTAMDRIYPNSGQHIEIFNKHARDLGWLIREDNSMPEGSVEFIDHSGKLTVSLDLPDPIIYPYMDSFRYVIDYDDSTIELSTHSGRHSHCLSSTEGGGPESEEEDSRVACCDCGGLVDQEDSYSDENGYDYCSDCYGERYGSCDRCNNDTSRESLSTVHTSRGERDWCGDCRSLRATECEDCNELFSTGIEETDGEYYCDDCRSGHTEECHACRETHLTENMEEHDDEWYCTVCLPEEVEDDATETADEEATAVVAAV